MTPPRRNIAKESRPVLGGSIAFKPTTEVEPAVLSHMITKKKDSTRLSFFFGGTERALLAVPEKLLELLRTSSFRNFNFA